MIRRRPLRPIQPQHIEVTPQGEQATLPKTPIEYVVTERGQGEYLPAGHFKPGEDPRRHRLTELECSLGGHVAALTLLTRYASAYADSDEEWEALAGSRLDTILRLRATMGGNSYISI